MSGLGSKRNAAYNAWALWLDGEITGAERDKATRRYAKEAGLSNGDPSTVDAILSARKEANKKRNASLRARKAAQRHSAKAKRITKQLSKVTQPAAQRRLSRALARENAATAAYNNKADEKRADYNTHVRTIRDSVAHENDKEKKLRRKLSDSKAKITDNLLSFVRSGKKTMAEIEDSADKWEDSAERAIRRAEIERNERVIEAPQEEEIEVIERRPGVEWQGGKLRSGNTEGETSHILLAVESFIDKYHRSSMPKNGITPNTLIRLTTEDGHVISTFVPVYILDAIARQSITGAYPNSKELLEFARKFAAMYGVTEIELSAADAEIIDT